MEAIQIDEERIREAEEEQTPTEAVAKTGTQSRMFKYSDFIDVGEGAAECEHARDGECEDVEHFHAWCRLPNPYQHEDIRRKAMAAKARRIRELKDPDSDASVVMDQQLAELGDEVFRETLMDELLQRDWALDYQEAQTDVDEREEYEHIQQDREEYQRLEAEQGHLPTDEQSDEHKQLVAHMMGYLDAIRDRLREVQQPKRDELASRSVESLVATLRDQRVDEDGSRAFLDTYNSWMWFVGTFKVALHPTLRRPHLPMWEEIGHRDRASAGTMYGEAPEVIDQLKITYNDLQIALQRGSAGN